MTFVPFDTEQVECRGVFRDENRCLHLDTTLTMTLNPNINAVSHKVQNNEPKDGTTLRRAAESGDAFDAICASHNLKTLIKAALIFLIKS